MKKFLAASLIWLALAVSAHATILFAGGEDVDFTCVNTGSCVVETSSVDYRTNWAREAYATATNGGGPFDPPPNRFMTPVFTANATIWVHAWYCAGTSSPCEVAMNNNQQLLRVDDSLGNPTLILRGNPGTNSLKISSRTSGGSFTDLATCTTSSFPAALVAQMDFFINYGSSGQVTLYVNGVQICNATGNVTNGDGATTLNQVEFGNIGSQVGSWSEVIVATQDTRSMNLFTLYPLASGNAVQWSNTSGSTPCPSLLGQTAINDANYVFTTSNTQLEQCTVFNSIPSGAYSALALIMSARSLVGATGPQHYQYVTRTGGTNYNSSNQTPNNSFNNLPNYIQSVNPATSSSWNVTDFTAGGFNIGLESEP